MSVSSLPGPGSGSTAGGEGTSDLPGLLVTHGARATEAVLLDLVDGLLQDDGPASLSRPVRVVVPSTSLRLHLGAALVRRRGAVLGITVQTLYGVAREILERCGQAPPAAGLPGDLPFEVLVRRLAGAEPSLAGGLDFLVDGYGAVAGSVRDLLDAGLEPVLAEAAEEALEAAVEDDFPATAAEIERGRALVRVASRVDQALAEVRAVRRAGLYSRAADLLVADPDHALPARAVLVHGFADATGLATELLVALVRHRDGRLLLDAPPDPAHRPHPGGSAGAGSGSTAAVEDGAPSSPGGRPPAQDLPPRWQEAFAERLRERLAGRAGEAEVEPPGGAPPAARVARFAAPGIDAEAREIAVRVHRLLDAGTSPERIGIVARDLEPLRRSLRHHLSVLGVPFSGIGAAGSLTAAGRRSRALLDLLRRRDELPADRWLDAAVRISRPSPSTAHDRAPFVDLRLAFYATGSGRLRDVAELDLDGLLGESLALPLPVRRGFSYAGGEESEDEHEPGGNPNADGEGGGTGDGRGSAAGEAARRRPPGTSFARRRRVPRSALAGAVEAAGALLARLRTWPGTALPAVHLERLGHLLLGELGWDSRDPASRPVFEALEALRRDLPPRLELTFDDLRLVLGRALDGAGRTPLGGRGGGVQVMSVVEARARTFDHLFVAGAHRGAFPRSVRPDPLLPDALRGALAAVLPDVPRKRAGFDEERYLFAQLLSAAPEVTVSWPAHDDEGQPLAPSPLVERLGDGRAAADGDSGDSDEEGVASAPPVYGTRPAGPAEGDGSAGGVGSAPGEGTGAGSRAAGSAGSYDRPAREEAILAALRGVPRPAYGSLLAAAVEESRRALPRPGLALDAAALAAARLRVLDEVDPDLEGEAGRATAATLGPYFGFLGPVPAERDDPRASPPWITHAENLAACPWQTFLRKVLRIEPTPDPLQALPGADPLLLGNVVHRVLEGLAESAGAPARTELPEVMAAAASGAGLPLAWPDDDELDCRLLAAADRALREEGVPLPGLVRALAGRARPYLERARDLERTRTVEGGEGGAGAPPLRVLGAEVRGEVGVEDEEGEVHPLRFIADRADATPQGVRLTDYKTGKPLATVKTEPARRGHHLAAVRNGTKLQAVAYGRAALDALDRKGAAAPSPATVPPEASGRYLYLRPDLEDPAAADYSAPAGDAAFDAAFDAAVRSLLAAWRHGAFFPRLVDTAGEKEPTRCRFCEVSEACLRGDSGARLRLHRWNHEHAGTASAAAERAHHQVWRLPDREPGDEAEGAGLPQRGAPGAPRDAPGEERR